MNLKPISKTQAEAIAGFFKPLENKHTFVSPDTMDLLMVTQVTIAPFRGTEQDDFIFMLQTGNDVVNSLFKYKGNEYTVLVIANALSIDKIVLTQPYFFEIWELNEKQMNGFTIPANLF